MSWNWNNWPWTNSGTVKTTDVGMEYILTVDEITRETDSGIKHEINLPGRFGTNKHYCYPAVITAFRPAPSLPLGAKVKVTIELVIDGDSL